MKGVINPFATNDAFNMTSLTRSINIVPNMYGRVKELGLFKSRGVATRTIMVEEKNGILNLIKSQPVGAPANKNKSGKRKVRSFVIPHLPLEDSILPSDYQGVRKFGSDSELETAVSVMNDKLASMRNKHAITLEHLRCGALKGIILDADGSTLYNLYSEFDITQKVVNFALGTTTTKVGAKCREVVRHIEDNLKGEIMSGVRALVGPGFFDAFVAHSSVQAAYAYHSEAAQRFGEDNRKGFKFNGITFEEYTGNATDAADNVRKFIGDDDAHFFPVGTQESFETVYAPGDFLETANTIGIELYARQEARKYNKGCDVYTESNPLPICNRPAMLVKGTRIAA